MGKKGWRRPPKLDADRKGERKTVTVRPCGGCGYFKTTTDLKPAYTLFGVVDLCERCRDRSG